MLALAALIPLCLLPLALWRPSAGWRSAMMSSAVVWGAAVAVSTELLSVISGLTPAAIAALWAAAGIGLIALLALRKPSAVPIALARVRAEARALRPFDGLLLCAVGAICATALFTGLVAAPNTFDSMAYHLARVEHWAQNASVAHYATHITRQLFFNPFAEYAILHLRLLSGGDGLAALPQWMAMCGSLLGTSLIAEQLGARRRGQLLAAVFAATVPMGVLQATSTQNDYVAAFWLVAAVHLLLRLRAAGRSAHIGDLLLLGLAFGLGVLTKATFAAFAVPFAIWLLPAWMRRAGIARSLPRALLALGLGLALCAPFFARNLTWFGALLAPPEFGADHANALFTPAALVSNVSRNLAIHLVTPIGAANALLDRAVGALHGAIGLSANDPRTTFPYERFGLQPAFFSTQEDYTGNALHLLVFGAASVWLMAQAVRGRQRVAGAFWLAAAAGFVVECMAVRWMPFNSRFHLPFFVIVAPVVGLALSELRRGWFASATALVLLASTLPWLLMNSNRPLAGRNSVLALQREQVYFLQQPALGEEYAQVADAVARSGCADVGLFIASNDWEYPLWPMLRARGSVAALRHVNTGLEAMGLVRAPAAAPCLVLTTATSEEWRARAVAGLNADYDIALQTAHIRVYARR